MQIFKFSSIPSEWNAQKKIVKKCNSTLLFAFKALNTGIAIAFIEFDFCFRIETCRAYLGKHHFSDLAQNKDCWYS